VLEEQLDTSLALRERGIVHVSWDIGPGQRRNDPWE
jgi:hypothetical protein